MLCGEWIALLALADALQVPRVRVIGVGFGFRACVFECVAVMRVLGFPARGRVVLALQLCLLRRPLCGRCTVAQATCLHALPASVTLVLQPCC